MTAQETLWLAGLLLLANCACSVVGIYFTSKRFWSRTLTKQLHRLELEVVNLQDLFAALQAQLKKLYGRQSMRTRRESGTASASNGALSGDEWKREMRKQLALGDVKHRE